MDDENRPAAGFLSGPENFRPEAKGEIIMKRAIAPFDYAKDILEAVDKGVLLTTKCGDKVNSMTIGWGTLGIEWGKPIFTAFIREGRFTREQLDKSMEFTVNVPYGEYDHKILGYCGSRTGRNLDKAKELGLTLVDGEKVEAPAIAELPLTLECKVLYKQLQDKNAIPKDIQTSMYPEDVDSSNPMANRDYHVAYYGEIVAAYILS